MKCVRCEEGTLVRIKFKETGLRAFLCDYCESIWFEGRDISPNTAFMLRTFQRGIDREYTLDEAEDKDQEHRPARHVNYR